MSILQRILQSSSYQVGLLFAALIVTGMAFAFYLLLLSLGVGPADASAGELRPSLMLISGGLMIVLLLIFALSYGVSYYVGTRFERVAATTRRIIDTGNLRERLPVDSSWDDLSKIAVLLNTMLAELELRVDGIKAVSDNIAHDLRTPLMRLRASIEEVEDEPRREALLGDLDQTLGIFRSLLRISAIEAGKQPLTLSEVEIDALVADAVALYEPVAEVKGIRIVSGGESVRANVDRDLLFQAVANLIDNAIKFGPNGSMVQVDLVGEEAHFEIRISDAGPGIPTAQRERVMARFQRMDASRSTPGNGLGLPLVLAIARRHGGELTLRDAVVPGEGSARTEAPGLTATLTIPLTGPRADAA